MYRDVGVVTADALAAYRALADRTDLAPGPGGSRITPVGAVPMGEAMGTGSIVMLAPSSQIVVHVDQPVKGHRYHVPLDTNDGCWAFHAGTWQQLTVGHIYQMDPTQPHGAVNWGPTKRRHVVVDVYGEISRDA